MTTKPKRHTRFGIKPRWQGATVYRLASPWSDLEKRFVQAWQEENGTNGRTDYLLAALLRPDIANDGNLGVRFLPKPSARECFVAATVLQWLGSNVGRAFLAKVLKIEIPVTERMRRAK